jgi:hypothetical protein
MAIIATAEKRFDRRNLMLNEGAAIYILYQRGATAGARNN